MAPRISKRDAHALAPRTLIVDNGAYTIKAGFASDVPDTEADCTIIPNCIAKGIHNQTWVGAQLSNCTDFADMAFRRPVQSGCLVNWEAEKEIWDQIFFTPGKPLYCDPSETNLLLTEALNSLANLQRHCDEVIFEEYEFAAYRRTAGVSINSYNDIAGTFGDSNPSETQRHPAECVLIIDSGYSHTIVAPIYKGKPIQQAVKRLEIGGKFMTNYLKEILSIRQLNVLNETHIVNHIKEIACYVSSDFKVDVEKARDHSGTGAIVQDYVMPDFTKRFVGELRKHNPSDRKQMTTFNSVRREDGTSEAILALSNERFSPPELLFNPSNIGMKQAGLAEIIIQSLTKVPTGLWPAMLANIYLVGGNAKLKGFKDRLFSEVRALAPAECEVRIETAVDTIKATWLGAARFASNSELLKETMLTKQDYQEIGHNPSFWTQRFFSSGQ